MYHRVIADKSEDPFDMGMCVTRERFEEQISYLARTCEIVPLGETMARPLAGRSRSAGAWCQSPSTTATATT